MLASSSRGLSRSRRGNVGAGLLLMAGVSAVAMSASAQSLPPNPQLTCVAGAGQPASAPAAFAGWFESGSVSLNGVVKPANSVTFANQPNCSFYSWAMQMFLWVTSPAPAVYGPGTRVFDSSVFFDVSPPDSNSFRTFVPHPVAPGFVRPMVPRFVQAGPHGLPVIMAKSGGLLEIKPPRLGATGKPTIANAAGKLVEVARVTVKAGKATLLDTTGKAIALPAARPAVTKALKKTTAAAKAQALIKTPITVSKLIFGRRPIFIDASGTVIEVEQGQADGGVLEAQNNSLLYSGAIVNDVFAYFLTGSAPGPGRITPTPTQFPTDQTALGQIETFAGGHGVTFPDADALAVELKTSWIDAAGLPNLDTYVTTQASVPTYDTSNPNKWTPNGTKTVTLALVGIHVVGSTAGHPEMIWASFEHVGNTPNATYQYNATSGTNPTTVGQPTTGTWLLTANAATSAASANAMHMCEPGEPDSSSLCVPLVANPTGDIVPISPFSISPSNTLRMKAFGAGSDTNPNPFDTPAASNTEIISINSNIRALMAAGGASADVRNNYIMLGATWTEGGNPPSGSFPAGNAVGTSKLANSTMETYEQGADTTSTSGSNCLDCHVTNTTSVSHIFPVIKPLF